ncbi:MAG TPA: glycosyltransferase family 39 protein [Trichormus sp.]|jgi:hypothetical protein
MTKIQVKSLLSKFLFMFNTGLLWLSWVLLVAFYGWNCYRGLTFTYSIEYESPLIWASWYLGRGHNIYELARLNQSPWMVTLTPPIYLSLGSLLVKLFGNVYWPFRICTILSLAATAVALYRMSRYCLASRKMALTALLFFLSATPVGLWAVRAKTDMDSAALSFWAVERFVHWWLSPAPLKKGMRGLIPVILLTLLSIFTKQEGVVVPFALFAFLIWQKLPRLAITCMLVEGALMVVGVGALQLFTGGYIEHQTYLCKAGLHWYWAVVDLAQLRPTAMAIPLGLLTYSAALLSRFKTKHEQPVVSQEPSGDEASLEERRVQLAWRLPLVLLVSCLVFNTYHLFSPYSNINALISFMFVLSWCLAICLPLLRQGWLTAILVTSLCSIPFIYFRPTTSDEAIRNADALIKSGRLAGKEVLSEDSYLNILSGSDAVMVDCASFDCSWKDDSHWLPLRQAISSRRYAAIMIYTGEGAYTFFPPEIVALIRKTYVYSGKVTGTGRDLDLYLPGPTAQAQPSPRPR